MNPVFLLDEIDKMGSDFRGDPASAMLEVLDPEINCHLPRITIWIWSLTSRTCCSSPRPTTLGISPRPLYDRMEIIELSSYTAQEKEQIAIRHLIPKQIEAAWADAGDPEDSRQAPCRR